MQTLVLTIHILIALALIGSVLLQRSEGGGLGIGGDGGAGGAGGGNGGDGGKLGGGDGGGASRRSTAARIA